MSPMSATCALFIGSSQKYLVKNVNYESLIIQFSLSSSYFTSLGSQYSSQRHILNHSQSMLFLWDEKDQVS